MHNESRLTDTDKGQGIGSRSGSDDLTDAHGDDDGVVVGGLASRSSQVVDVVSRRCLTAT